MARYNEILVGRFNRALQKAFSMKGEPPAPQLASEIAATISHFWGAEMRYLESWERFGARVNLPAGGAGNFGIARLANPATSNMIAVVERIIVTNLSAAAMQVDLLVNPALSASLVTPGNNPQPFDTRGRASGTLVMTSKNNSVAQSPGVNVGIFSLPTQTDRDLIITDLLEIPLLPGESYDVQAEQANAQFTVGWWWRERFLEDSERT